MNQSEGGEDTKRDKAQWDHSTHDPFFEYYARQSTSVHSVARFVAMRDVVLRAVPTKSGPLDVADLGCGAGTQSFVWAQLGHRLHGLDISAKFIQLGMERASQAGLQVDFRVGSVTDLPWPDESMDICLAIELLEHVADWRRCLDEFTRVLRRGGALFLTTTNTLCPKQQEFNLPMYSWYPAWVKRHYQRLAQTTRPELVTYATYPAVNWFTFYGLRRELGRRGCHSLDRFDLIDPAKKSVAKRIAVSAVRALPPARLLAHMATPSTWILAIRR
jgi:2-polyprenyl-6-hydroxyphenyl methylase/3-demethylubiquinone-9 3-methyltransferase